jgi:hypothetical protein
MSEGWFWSLLSDGKWAVRSRDTNMFILRDAKFCAGVLHECRLLSGFREKNNCTLLGSTILTTCGPGSSVGIATGYGLDGPGIESRWRREFPNLSRPALRPTQPPVQWVPGLSRGFYVIRARSICPEAHDPYAPQPMRLIVQLSRG